MGPKASVFLSWKPIPELVPRQLSKLVRSSSTDLLYCLHIRTYRAEPLTCVTALTQFSSQRNENLQPRTEKSLEHFGQVSSPRIWSSLDRVRLWYWTLVGQVPDGDGDVVANCMASADVERHLSWACGEDGGRQRDLELCQVGGNVGVGLKRGCRQPTCHNFDYERSWQVERRLGSGINYAAIRWPGILIRIRICQHNADISQILTWPGDALGKFLELIFLSYSISKHLKK